MEPQFNDTALKCPDVNNARLSHSAVRGLREEMFSFQRKGSGVEGAGEPSNVQRTWLSTRARNMQGQSSWFPGEGPTLSRPSCVFV